jgi:hypothetical protein
MRDLNWFRSLSRRDFENGAVLDEIERVFEERDRFRELWRIARGGDPADPDHWPVPYDPMTGIAG